MGLILLVSMLFAPPAMDRNYAGTFTAHTEMGTFTLILRQAGAAQYEGELLGEGGMFSLEAGEEGGLLEGTADDGYEILTIQIKRDGDQLTFLIFEEDEDGAAVSGTEESLVFTLSTDVTNGIQESVREDVRINGMLLTDEQLTALSEVYGKTPMPGDYWYDSRSGLYGAVGFPAYGFMMPDHLFDSMGSDVSRGNTGVFVNGRELPASEYAVWSYIVGSWIQQGRYWLDHQGNAGYEGDPTVVTNLFVAAQQNSYRGQGGSGDNFWSTRFSAGNSNADNSQGYVSVPGYGPVGYGF
ncbi:MAG: hypothetical protein OEV30_06070 [Ignavibacteria bacterium]|nr:hypothetical protein [Ignavibacteria bacterium]